MVVCWNAPKWPWSKLKDIATFSCLPLCSAHDVTCPFLWPRGQPALSSTQVYSTGARKHGNSVVVSLNLFFQHQKSVIQFHHKKEGQSTQLQNKVSQITSCMKSQDKWGSRTKQLTVFHAQPMSLHSHFCEFGGSQGDPSWGLASLCCCALPLVMCRGADVGASMCHLPLAPEGNETQQDFTEGYQLLMGMDPTTPKVRDTPEIQRIWWKKFFECCTCFQQTDLSAALSWKKLWKMHYLQKMVNRRFASLKGQVKHNSLSQHTKDLIQG